MIKKADWRERLYVGLALATAGVCISLAITAIAIAYPAVKARLGYASPPVAAYQIGTRVDLPSRIFDTAERTLIVFARSTCPACDHSRPALSAATKCFSQPRTSDVALITTAPRAERELSFARDIGIPDTRVFALNVAALRLERVPTVIVVDRAGRIVFQYEGELGEGHVASLSAVARGADASVSISC